MNRNNNLPVGLIIGAVALLALGAVTGRTSTILTILGIGAGLILMIVGLVMFLALKNSSEEAKAKAADGKALAPEDAAILGQARQVLTELRMFCTRIQDLKVRESCSSSCGTVEKIMSAVKEQPEDFRNAQLYFQYYLPTERDMIKKYLQMEKSGLATDELKGKILSYLEQIRTTSDAQLSALFENDIMDINTELELMKQSMEEAGLL